MFQFTRKSKINPEKCQNKLSLLELMKQILMTRQHRIMLDPIVNLINQIKLTRPHFERLGMDLVAYVLFDVTSLENQTSNSLVPM